MRLQSSGQVRIDVFHRKGEWFVTAGNLLTGVSEKRRDACADVAKKLEELIAALETTASALTLPAKSLSDRWDHAILSWTDRVLRKPRPYRAHTEYWRADDFLDLFAG